MKKLSVLVLVVLCMIFAALTVYAEDLVPYASESIRDTGISIDVSGDRVYAIATVGATSIASKIGFSQITLYHKVNGRWEVAASKSNDYGANSKTYGSEVSCQKVSGREYKASCSSMATVNGISDTGSASVGPTTVY